MFSFSKIRKKRVEGGKIWNFVSKMKKKEREGEREEVKNTKMITKERENICFGNDK